MNLKIKARLTWGIGALVTAGAVAGLVGVGVTNRHTIAGDPIANPVQVVQAASDREKAEAAAAAEEQKRAEAAALTDLQNQVRDSMQVFFDDPANDADQFQFVVHSVMLVNTGLNTYDGSAVMSAQGRPDQQQVTIDVIADGQTFKWHVEGDALDQLLR